MLRVALGWLAFLSCLLSVGFLLPPCARGESPQVQEIKGRLELQENLLYEVPGLKAGDRFSVYLKGVSGTLDPFAAILKPGVDLETLQRDYLPELAKKRNFFQAKPEALAALNDKFFAAWDDNSGKGHAACFAFTAPAPGTFRLLVCSTPWRPTFGNFQMLLGLNAPAVMSGKAQPTDHLLANHDKAVWQAGKRVDEINGELSVEQQYRSVGLNRIYQGETLYVRLEVTSGSLPVVVLQDYSGIPLVSGHPQNDKKILTLTHTFGETDNSPRLRVFFPPGPGKPRHCAYRLLVGLNAPQVLTGRAHKHGRPIIEHPIPVEIGLRMDQITNVDQKGENFGVVASLKLIWRDPALGFNPEECQCFVKTYSGDAFQRFVADKGLRWPEFAIFNQQGNRWFQNRLVLVWPDGWCIYYERFSVTLQAPDFDFRRFPFDHQDFYIRVDSLRPDWIYVFKELKGFSEVGKQLGEEEWVVTGFNTQFSTQTQTTDLAGSRFSFHFRAKRHLTFYLFRIFLPILIILSVSWFTFFLKDYSKRVDVAGGNLLLFIAFNFAIAGLLPHLGYLTFLDLILIITFVITSFVLLLSVVLKRLEMDGKMKHVQMVDKMVIIFYPLAYIIAVIIIIAQVW
ncbi:MAG: hypothetical protein PHU44_07910 [Syntrophales bacterium]|nr:hypothetical protein [Syntrophales bacterium]